MRSLGFIAWILVFASPSGAQIVATLSNDQITIRNNASSDLVAYAIVVRLRETSRQPFTIYSDLAIDPAFKPIPGRGERVIMANPAHRADERGPYLQTPVLAGGIYSDGSTTG